MQELNRQNRQAEQANRQLTDALQEVRRQAAVLDQHKKENQKK